MLISAFVRHLKVGSLKRFDFPLVVPAKDFALEFPRANVLPALYQPSGYVVNVFSGSAPVSKRCV